MKIKVAGISDSSYLRSIQHIIALFYEEPEWVEQGFDICVTFECTTQRNELLARVTLDTKGETFQEEKREAIKDTESIARLEKYAYRYVVLKAFERMTGVIQGWGMLTGIRPMKLYHNRWKEQKTEQEIKQQLKKDFAIQEEKVTLMSEIAKRQLEAIPDLYNLKQAVSLYIGIPFCPTKCAYCTFPAYAIGGKQGSVNGFLSGLHYEIKEIGKTLKQLNIPVTTIYFGGGTPTSITAEEMDALYEEMYRLIPMEQVREITVEAGRPDTITEEKLRILKKWKIDRISINPQSYTEETLKAIGRHHTVEETIEKYWVAREFGMTNINMDLIIGLPNETIATFAHSLQETEKLKPESVTVHTLSFKRASTMTKNREKYDVASREEVQEMMKLAEQWMKEHAYYPYYVYRQKNILGNLENVGYSLKGKESLYNILIMEEQQSIIGLGCGAASKYVHPVTGKITRFANAKEPKAYNEKFEYYTHEKIKHLQELFLSI